MSPLAPLRVVPRMALLGALAGAAAIPADAVPADAVSGIENVPGALAPGDPQTLLAAGLDQDAERALREAIAGGDSTARAPLLTLLVRRGDARDARRQLREWGGPSSLTDDGAVFLAARIHESAGDLDAALDGYREAAAREPLLSDHAMFRSGVVLETLGRTEEAIVAFDDASAAARTSRLAALAAFRGAGLAMARDDPARGRELLERVPLRSAVAPADRLELEARIARAEQDSTAERGALRKLLPAASGAVVLEAMDRLLALGPPPTADERLELGRIALEKGHPVRAIEEATAVLRDIGKAKDPVREGRARLLRGRGNVARREFSAARDEFARLPAGARPLDRALAALEASRCLWKLGQIDAALAEYDALARGAFPDSVRALAVWEAAREAKDDGRWVDAARRYGDFQQSWPGHEFAPDALWQRGRTLAESGDPAGALATFAELRRLHPSVPVLEEAMYWAVRLHEAAGDSARTCNGINSLRLAFPDGYWTQRAIDIAKERGCPDFPPAPLAEHDVTPWLARAFSAARTAGERDAAAVRSSEPFRRARVLASVDLREEGEAELAGLRRTFDADPAELLALAQGAWSIGLPREAMRAAWVLKRRARADILSGDLPPAVARLLYPVPYLDSVRRHAEENRLDPLFVYAVMREESWFDPAAVSTAGARGLLQIMPATGYDLATRVRRRGFSAGDLFDPETNVQLGARYLRELLDAFEREPALALAAYNAGKGNAMRWREGQEGAFDVDRYVTSITYRETYGYVQKVLRSWAIYRALWGPTLERLGASTGAAGHAR